MKLSNRSIMKQPYRNLPLLMLFVLCVGTLSSCRTTSATSSPFDFFFILDAHSGNRAENIYIQIDGQGSGRFERYDTGGTISYDENHMVVYERNQVVDKGTFQLSAEQVNRLWQAIDKNNFFQLTDDYRMAIGYSYAFISIEANGQKHQVDNIGMEVTEIRTIVETVNSMLPSNAKIVYGEGYVP